MSYYKRLQNTKRSEATEQEQVINWCGWQQAQHPELKLIFHIPNGGSRNKAEAANLKRQGVKAGVPDICLPVPKGGFHGLYIEMKYGRNKTTDDQEEWLAALKEQGYFTAVCYGAEEAERTIARYLQFPGYPAIESGLSAKEYDNPEEVTVKTLIEILEGMDPEAVVISGSEKNIRVYPGRENKKCGRNIILLC